MATWEVIENIKDIVFLIAEYNKELIDMPCNLFLWNLYKRRHKLKFDKFCTLKFIYDPLFKNQFIQSKYSSHYYYCDKTNQNINRFEVPEKLTFSSFKYSIHGIKYNQSDLKKENVTIVQKLISKENPVGKSVRAYTKFTASNNCEKLYIYIGAIPIQDVPLKVKGSKDIQIVQGIVVADLLKTLNVMMEIDDSDFHDFDRSLHKSRVSLIIFIVM